MTYGINQSASKANRASTPTTIITANGIRRLSSREIVSLSMSPFPLRHLIAQRRKVERAFRFIEMRSNQSTVAGDARQSRGD